MHVQQPEHLPSLLACQWETMRGCETGQANSAEARVTNVH